MTAHCLELVDVLGYAPVDPTFDETPAKRDQSTSPASTSRMPSCAPTWRCRLRRSCRPSSSTRPARCSPGTGRPARSTPTDASTTSSITASSRPGSPAEAPVHLHPHAARPRARRRLPDTVFGDATGTLIFAEVVRNRRQRSGSRSSSRAGAARGRRARLLAGAPGTSPERPGASRCRWVLPRRRVRPASAAALGRALVLGLRDRPADRRHPHVPRLNQVPAKTQQAAHLDLLFHDTAATFWRFTTHGT